MTSVVQAENGTTHFDFSDTLPVGHEVVAAISEQSTSEEERRSTIRQELRRLRVAARAFVTSEDPEDNLKRVSINDRFYDDNLYERAADLPFLPKKKITNWLARATNDELKAFCLWNSEYARDLDRNFQADLPLLQSNTMYRVEHLVENGVFPPAATDIFHKTHQTVTDISTMDSFAAGAERANGMFSTTGPSMTFSDLYLFNSPSPQMQDTVFHEDMHASGHINRSGFINMRLFEEFLVAHTTAVASTRVLEADVFDPLERSSIHRGSYQAERRLMALVLKFGSTPLDIRNMTDAYFAAGCYTKPRIHVLRALDNNVKEVVPGYQATGISGLVDAYEAAFGTHMYKGFISDLLKSTLSRVDAIGVVESPIEGVFDTEKQALVADSSV